MALLVPLFYVVDLETSNAVMPAAEELMMLSRLLIMPVVSTQCRSYRSICAC